MTEANTTLQGKTHVFIDGQNLYLSARSALKVPYPNFDAKSIGNMLANKIGVDQAESIHFYTGMPVRKYSPKWFSFWTNKLDAMEDDGVEVFTTPLRYQTETDPNEKCGFRVINTREKGIDTAIVLDVMEAARRSDCENIIIVSRDQDFSLLIDRIQMMCDFERRDIGLYSAYPDGGKNASHIRGIKGTTDLQITRADYDACLDPRYYWGNVDRNNHAVDRDISPH